VIPRLAAQHLGARRTLVPAGTKNNSCLSPFIDILGDKAVDRLELQAFRTPAEIAAWRGVAFTNQVDPEAVFVQWCQAMGIDREVAGASRLVDAFWVKISSMAIVNISEKYFADASGASPWQAITFVRKVRLFRDRRGSSYGWGYCCLQTTVLRRVQRKSRIL